MKLPIVTVYKYLTDVNRNIGQKTRASFKARLIRGSRMALLRLRSFLFIYYCFQM